MSTSNDIIGACRANIKKRLPRPRLSDIDATIYTDPIEKFIVQATAAGCMVVRGKGKKDLDTIISEYYPDAKVIASAMPEVKSATVNPNEVKSPQELNGTDVGVIEGKFGVAENGAIWVPQEVKERAIDFISENIIATVPESEIVSNMHEAYPKITFSDYGYGVFIAGPSKTADIAQVLVMGAQAARSMTIVLV